MRSRAVVLGLFLVAVLGSAACKKVEPAEQKALLASEDPKKREGAAEELRKLYTKDPKALGDLGKETWTERVKNLPSEDAARQRELLKQPVSPKGVADYRLDDFWTVTVRRDATMKVVAAEGPTRNVAFVDVKPGAGFTGTWTTYYVTGVPHTVDDYADGKLKHTREMFDTGSLRREAEMVQSAIAGTAVPHGTVVTRYPDGKPETEEVFDHGVLSGVRKQFYPSGKLRLEGPYRDGALDGTLINYREDGSQEWCIIYDKGREVNRGCPPK